MSVLTLRQMQHLAAVAAREDATPAQQIEAFALLVELLTDIEGHCKVHGVHPDTPDPLEVLLDTVMWSYVATPPNIDTRNA